MTPESFLDRTYSEVVTPRILEERRCVTEGKGGNSGVQETQVAVPNENRYALLRTVGGDDASSLCGGQFDGSNPRDILDRRDRRRAEP